MVHTNAIAYGFLANAFLGALHWAVPRLSLHPVASRKLSYFIFYAWQFVVLSTAAALILGPSLQDAEWVAEFSDLAIVPEIVAVKKGTSTQDNHVDSITGATISSKAVVRIINETHTAWAEQLPAPGTEPPLAGDPADSGTGQ